MMVTKSEALAPRTSWFTRRWRTEEEIARVRIGFWLFCIAEAAMCVILVRIASPYLHHEATTRAVVIGVATWILAFDVSKDFFRVNQPITTNLRRLFRNPLIASMLLAHACTLLESLNILVPTSLCGITLTTGIAFSWIGVMGIVLGACLTPFAPELPDLNRQ